MAAVDLPVLIVGDVHGDIERLFQALKPYPADSWHTVFLGDLVDYGMFGVGVMRFARDRPNTDVLLGNHEIAMLQALHQPDRVGWWISIGGHAHELEELRKDEELQQWMVTRPLMLELSDRTLAQHCGNDDYRMLIQDGDRDPIASINESAALLLETHKENLLWDVMSAKGNFAAQPDRLERWLQLTNSRRVVFDHTPHHEQQPASYHDGKAINFDGGLARYHYRRIAPLAASVGPLPP